MPRKPGHVAAIKEAKDPLEMYWLAIFGTRPNSSEASVQLVKILRNYLDHDGSPLAAFLGQGWVWSDEERRTAKALEFVLYRLQIAIEERDLDPLRGFLDAIEMDDRQLELKPDMVRAYLVDKYRAWAKAGLKQPPKPTLQQLQREIAKAVEGEDGKDKLLPLSVISRICQELKIDVKLSGRGAPRGPRGKQQ
ncbi:MAG: hypothetical protein JNL10_21245 [Verrucomicrobiales bacterium]|nr:hypothetical protein [Verrucomicrobiales bacterium]